MNEQRKSNPSDVSDEEWAFCVRYLTLMSEQAPQRIYPLREIFDAVRYLVKMGGVWRMMLHDLQPWQVVYQQTRRWIKAGCFEAMAHDLRTILRLALDRKADPSAVILDSRTLQLTPESGARAGFDGHKKRKGSKVHAAVDTLGHLLALTVTSANQQDRAQVGQLAQAIQSAVDEPVQIAFVDQGYTGEQPAAAAAHAGIQPEVVKHHEATTRSTASSLDRSTDEWACPRMSTDTWAVFLHHAHSILTRTATVSGTNATILSPAAGSFTFGKADRGRLERVNLSVALPVDPLADSDGDGVSN